jgi:hypothetical protein
MAICTERRYQIAWVLYPRDHPPDSNTTVVCLTWSWPAKLHINPPSNLERQYADTETQASARMVTGAIGNHKRVEHTHHSTVGA